VKRLPPLDMSMLGKYLIPAAIVIAVFVYIFVRKFVLSYLELRNRVRVQEHAAKARAGAAPGKVEPVIVRRTDLFEQLTPQQKLIHKQAEDLAAQKHFKEASKLFESINFQRKAIDLLEFNGFIEEAAQILIRMKVPYRAAIIYERNNQHVRAAECFTMDNKHDSAGRSYEKAAIADYHFFKKAGESYFAAGMVDNCLEVYAKILLSAEILKVCIGSNKYEFLASYMADPYNAKHILEHMAADQIQNLIQNINLRPSWVQSMSVWVLYHHELSFFHSILFKLISHKDLSILFWSHISGAYCAHLLDSLSKNALVFKRETYEYHGSVLIGMQRTQLGEFFLKTATQIPPV
jgi:tetratricopeptide (TPR) repeat protein